MNVDRIMSRNPVTCPPHVAMGAHAQDGRLREPLVSVAMTKAPRRSPPSASRGDP
jgi:hypothetical protein